MVGSKTTTQSETEKKVTKTVLQSEHKDVTTDSLIDAGRKKKSVLFGCYKSCEQFTEVKCQNYVSRTSFAS